MNYRHQEAGKCRHDLLQEQRIHLVFSEECLPLLLFLPILYKRRRKTEGHLIRQCGLAASERRPNGLVQHLTVEIGVGCQHPEIEVILHAAVGDTQGSQRLEFFRDHGITGIDPELRCIHPREDYRVLGDLRRGSDGIAKPDVNLNLAARPVDEAKQRYAHAAVMGFLANFGSADRIGLKRDAV